VTKLIPDSWPAIQAVHGWADVYQANFTTSLNEVKANAKTINSALTGDWLVGNTVTLADIALASFFIIAQQTLIDGGFRKAMPKFSAWFERVTGLPEFVRVAGNIKVAAKTVKPVIKAEEKVAAPAKKAAAAKPKDNDDDEDKPQKKAANPLDLLPPTTFDLFNFKTLFVNIKDKKGEGIEELKKQFDPAGFSLWFLHYDKYKGEGEKLYITNNLCNGFLQRFDEFRKYCLARHLVLGDEPNLEIEGVWLWRGTGIPQEAIDHPQFEYYKTRKLDLNVKEDEDLIRAFWGAEYTDKINGQTIQSINWHK
jgi:elongation factor 1-gamma